MVACCGKALSAGPESHPMNPAAAVTDINSMTVPSTTSIKRVPGFRKLSIFNVITVSFAKAEGMLAILLYEGGMAMEHWVATFRSRAGHSRPDCVVRNGISINFLACVPRCTGLFNLITNYSADRCATDRAERTPSS
jgi:hypothetical protein